jgi:hypothetical protein
MLREAGKKDIESLRSFLREHHPHMPRTMLRYAIEKLLPQERKEWMGNRALIQKGETARPKKKRGARDRSSPQKVRRKDDSKITPDR